MPSYAALLRAVNLGGNSTVRMAEWKLLLERRGFSDVRTLLQSGNVVFRTAETSGDQLERVIEAGLERDLHVRTSAFVRTSAELRTLMAANPFPKEARRDPSHLAVSFLRATPPAAAWERLGAAVRGRERFQGAGRQAFVYYPDGIGRSKLTAAVIERALETPSTARNWNTVGKLASLATE